MNSAQSAGPERSVRFILRAFAVLFVLVAVAFALVSFAPYQQLRAFAISSVPPAYQDRFTPALYHKIVMSLRAGAGLFGVAALAINLFVRQLTALASEGVVQVRALCNLTGIRIRGMKNDGALHLVAFAFVLLWGIALRLRFYSEPLRNDEAYTYLHYAARPLLVGLAYYTANNHLLNTMLMHLSTAVFGNAVWALRLPTLIVGILLLPVSYATARTYAGKNAALLTAALVSASSPLVEFSFNARGYTLAAFFFVIAIGLVRLIERKVTGAWVVLPVIAALMMYSVPTMVYAAGGIFVYLLLTRLGIVRVLIAGLCTGILTALLYAPVLATVGPASITSNQWTAPIPRALWLPTFVEEARGLWMYWNLDVPLLVSILLAVAFLACLAFPKTWRSSEIGVLLCVLAVACLLMPVQRVVPPRRTFLFLLPVYLAAAAAGWNLVLRRFSRPERTASILAVVVACAMGIKVLHGKSLENPIHPEATGIRSADAIIQTLRPELASGDQFVCTRHEDAELAYTMVRDKTPYNPTRSGDFLIVTPLNAGPDRILREAGIPPDQVTNIHKIDHFEDRNVYVGGRGAQLPFKPEGDVAMGWFE